MSIQLDLFHINDSEKIIYGLTRCEILKHYCINLYNLCFGFYRIISNSEDAIHPKEHFISKKSQQILQCLCAYYLLSNY